MTKPCSLCGFPSQEKPPFHYPYCTPGLRALVRAAEKWFFAWQTADAGNVTDLDAADEVFARAVARFRKERKR